MPRFYEEILDSGDKIRMAIETLDHDEGIRAEIVYKNRQAILFVTRGVIKGYSVSIYDFGEWQLKERLCFCTFEEPEGVLNFISKYIKGKVYKY
ncbi:MAG: hypothetical protein JRN26_03455 [Nitrososphaerota archaeon]|jgi:hypothetical protein|nr:hypothetical protein [Nitrososphaerota archaeon]MDG6927063.1 hypothetical protein [Nitrososphaerota archaeon]MDG6930563.1 hypothetical protein [Nitrososphaerota archaeon]MDG6932370.1 hypothetical protein [Nitrososphaerota archaeon]MDG6935929.1 hypothetical protein [Nitrososphaerota archaeon]